MLGIRLSGRVLAPTYKAVSSSVVTHTHTHTICMIGLYNLESKDKTSFKTKL